MELIGKANLQTVSHFPERARSQAPFLHRHCPVSSVLRACPPPHTTRPAPHGVPVASHDLASEGLPVFRSISSSMHAGATTPAEPLDAVALPSNDHGLPQKPAGSASAPSLFEACSAFTHVPACMVAKSPKVTRFQSISTHSLPPAPLWLLPAERPIGRVGFAPTGDRRLSRHTGLTGIRSCGIL